MLGTLLTDSAGKPKSIPSQYQPSHEIGVLTLKIKQDYEVGIGILNRPFREFNDMSLLARMDADQKTFNAYIQPKSDNPDDAWRWNGVRPMTHNKVMSMAAYFVAQTLYPNVFAQNDRDEQDRLAGEVMKCLIEYNIRNSDYEISYLYAIVAALVNPVAYMQIEFTESMQKIRVKLEDGKISQQEAVDDVLSGFQANNVPADEVLIANAYQYYLQKQRFIIKRRFVDYDELKTKYGQHENWQYITPGIKVFYQEADSTFYEQVDDNLITLGEEVIYYNRLEDLEIPYVNGIYFGKSDTEANFIKHRDTQNRPKYNLAKFGFQPIDEKRFFFYRSLVMNCESDQKLLDRVWRMTFDGTFLRLFRPIVGIGTGKLDSNLVYPGGQFSLPAGSDIKPLDVGSDLNAGWNAVGQIERSIDESSQSKVMQGQIEEEKRTLGEIARAERASKIQLNIFSKMLAQFIKEFGQLMIDAIIQHQTVGEAEETLGGQVKLKFRTFLLPEQVENGRKISKKIKFEPKLIGRKYTQKELERESFRIAKEQGGLKSETKLYEINPDVFSKLKYQIYISADELMPKNEELEEIINLRRYDRFIINPFINKKTATRRLLVEPVAKGDTDEFMLSDEELQKMSGAGAFPQAKEEPQERSLQSLMETI